MKEEIIRDALIDCLSLLKGEIDGPAQRAAIIREAQAALDGSTSTDDLLKEEIAAALDSWRPQWRTLNKESQERNWRHCRAALEAEYREENKRLHAINSDLLAALIEARKHLEDYEEHFSGEKYNNTQINAAIAKAKGRP